MFESQIYLSALQQKLNRELLSSFCPVHGASDRLLILSGVFKAGRVCMCFVDLTAFHGGVGGTPPTWAGLSHQFCFSIVIDKFSQGSPRLSDSVFSRSHVIFCRWSDSVRVIKQHRPAYSGVSATQPEVAGNKTQHLQVCFSVRKVEYPLQSVNEVFMSDGGSVELTGGLVRGQECCGYRISLS